MRYFSKFSDADSFVATKGRHEVYIPFDLAVLAQDTPNIALTMDMSRGLTGDEISAAG